ncbi:MAG: DNA-processing protein DprA [Candidatus Omnitrophica bacterium]|nr:DNA-processing protein DprA [Candidatus Omnitrophota bacterium]MDD5653692.1 DNA-processing protein DprA [Candidatus Omnitrophota bacterium]
MTDFEALVLLNMVPEIGSIRLKRLMEFFGTAQNILQAPEEKLTIVCGIAKIIAAKISALKTKDLNQEFTRAKRENIAIITQDDPGYPQNLKNIIDPPPVLYLKGKFKPEDNIGIAVVGSRRASFYGLDSARIFSSRLAERGFTIVSGMARGIDTAAHQGALKACGRTVAAIGSGFNHLYPEENRQLAEEIAQNGAVISEFPMDTLPLKQNFPRRNRIISGLSLGVLVVEAAQNSGALITADFALEQGREVFALPGKVDAENSCGTNALIKDGAKLVSCVDDITEEFNFTAQKQKAKRNRAKESKIEFPAVYDLISEEPVQLDDLLEKSSLDMQHLSCSLLQLQLGKLIKQLPGKYFVRRQNER